MDEILFPKKRVTPRPPLVDTETIDLFTGEPHGAPPPAVLNPAEAQARADEGMRAAFDHQTEEWRKWALARVRLALKKMPELTVDDVWVEIGREPRSHSEGSAMGAVMREAGKRGWCRKIPGRAVRSARAANHGALRPVWQSLIVEVSHG